MQLLFVVLLPLVGALLPALANRAGRSAAAGTAFLVSATSLVLLLTAAGGVFDGEVVTFDYPWLPALGLDISFWIDGLSLFFASLILGIGLLIIVYARFYLGREDDMGRFLAFILLFQGAMVGLVLSNNILLLLVFWELTSLSSFLLIGFWSHLPAGRQGARMALIVTGAGGLAMIAGMLLLGDIAGSYRISDILAAGEEIQASPLYDLALVLVLAGAFTKSAQFPFHFWLPHAMAAPTPVSAYLHSATMVKAGLFLMARLWPVLAGTELWFWIVAPVGLATMVIAAWIALFKNDLKAILAYSTVSHLGFITMLLGFGEPAAAIAAVFHILNHATFKCALFMTAGIVDHEAGTRDPEKLGGLLVFMPITGTIAIVTALSMAGVPPLNGFISKEMILESAWHETAASWAFPAFAALGALFSVAYSLRYFAHVFLGPRQAHYPHHPHDPGPGMWLPPALLTLAVVAIGLFPQAIAGELVAVVSGAVIGEAQPAVKLSLWHGLTPALYLSIAALTGGALLLWAYRPAKRLRESVPRPEAKTIFEWLVEMAVVLARRATEGLHNGSLQRYLAFAIGAAIVVGYSAFLGAPHLPGERATLAPNLVIITGWLLLAGACVAIVILQRRRLMVLVLIGVIGLFVSVGFLYFSAPDLALTQISVEVVSVILMLLALNLLPKTSPRESSNLRRGRDAVLAILSGLGIGWVVYAVLTRDFVSISDYHLAQSYVGGGGTNVVNVILVDFRGFDTFGEIIVIGIAALIVYALMDSALRGVAGRRLARWQVDQRRSADRHPLLLVVGARALLPLALLVGVYIFLRGHNEPGGGFIAGLVVAIALVAQYMASGFGWAQERMRLDYHATVGIGVLIAGMTGVGAWFAGRPFLTSDFGYVTLPVVGKFELATAMLFDLGVFLTVVGGVMLALANLSRVARRTTHEAVSKEPMDVDPSRHHRPATAAVPEGE